MEISDYIASIPENRKERFLSLIDVITSLYPNAIASMKYKMPTYEEGEGWVSVANQKNYISLYTCSSQHLESFKKKHAEIKTGKGCINFRDRDEIPLQDLEPVIKSAIEYSHS